MEKNPVMKNDDLSLEANLDIIIYLVTQFSDSTDSYEFEDLLQVAYLGALKAIRSYDEEIGPLKPYVFSCVRNHLLRFLKPLGKVRFLFNSKVIVKTVHESMKSMYGHPKP